MFNQTRIKLTAWYLLIIMIVSATFSLIIFTMLSAEIERLAIFQRTRFERRLSRSQMPPPFVEAPIVLPSNELIIIDADLVRDSKERILIVLITINGAILFLSGGLGYFLAGKTLKPIQNMIDAQNQFVSDASHELRTPLTSIKTASEVALRDPNFSLQKAKIIIKDNLTEVEHLQSLSEKLLELGQLDKQKTGIKLESCDITPIINNVVKTIKPQADDKKLSLVTDLSCKTFYVNKQMFSTLMTIIIDNAVKYSDKSGTIKIQSLQQDKLCMIKVIDEGKGIEPTDLPHIFDRFYRADSARSKTAISGYGLGLSIAQQIITMHKGKITVASQIGKGSTFTLIFPVLSQI